MNNTLGKLIRDAREGLGLSQQQLADALGVARNSVSNWECGMSTPGPRMLRALCDYLGIEAPDASLPEMAQEAVAMEIAVHSCTHCRYLQRMGRGLNRRFVCGRSGAVIAPEDLSGSPCGHEIVYRRARRIAAAHGGVMAR